MTHESCPSSPPVKSAGNVVHRLSDGLFAVRKANRNNERNQDIAHFLHQMNSDEEEAAWVMPLVGTHLTRFRRDHWSLPVTVISAGTDMRGTAVVNPLVDPQLFATALEALDTPRASALLVASVACSGCIYLADPDLAPLACVLSWRDEASSSIPACVQHTNYAAWWPIVLVDGHDHVYEATDLTCTCAFHAGTVDGAATVPSRSSKSPDATALDVADTVGLLEVIFRAMTLAIRLALPPHCVTFLSELRQFVMDYLLLAAIVNDTSHPEGMLSPEHAVGVCGSAIRALYQQRTECDKAGLSPPRALDVRISSKMIVSSRFREVILPFVGYTAAQMRTANNPISEAAGDVPSAGALIPPPAARIVYRQVEDEYHSRHNRDGALLADCRICCADASLPAPPLHVKITNGDSSQDPDRAYAFHAPVWLLLARWPWFRSLMKSGLNESKSRVVNLDVSRDVLYTLHTCLASHYAVRLLEVLDTDLFDACTDAFPPIGLDRTSMITLYHREDAETSTAALLSDIGTIRTTLDGANVVAIPAVGNRIVRGQVNNVVGNNVFIGGGANGLAHAGVGAWPHRVSWSTVALHLVVNVIGPKILKVACVAAISYGVFMWKVTNV